MFEIKQSIQKITEITEATNQSLTSELLCSTTPVVLRGLIKDWPLVTQANMSNHAAQSYLRQHYNQKKIRTFSADAKHKGRFFYNDDLSGFNFSATTTTFDKVLDDLAEFEHQPNPPGLYMGSTSVDHILPSFRHDNDLPFLVENPLISVWVGNQSRIAAHYDVTDNIACVAAGKRRFTLFPPNQLDNLYVGPLDFTPAGQSASLVDFAKPDLDKYPRFEEAMQHAQVAELEAGDAIFIPSMWWHHVEGLSCFNVLVNYWWRQVDIQIGAPMDALNHALLSIRDLPQAQRDAWRDIFEHYIFAPKEQIHIPKDKRGVLNPIDEPLARKLRATLVNKLNR
jgi:hypothetical protein